MMKNKPAMLVLLCALAMPLPAAAAVDDIFSVMFRMMLVMMNVMSDAMLGNSMNNGFTQGNNFGFGMGGLSAMNPMMGVSTFPGMSPWSGMGGFPGMSPWSGVPGMSPWSGMPGMSPWSNSGGYPGSGYGMSPWSTPIMGDSWASPYAGGPYSAAGYANPTSLLEGRWFGRSGEILEVYGNRFRLQHGQYNTNGAINIENNIVSLYSQDTGTVTQYTFIRNQSDLMLQDAAGQVLSFTQRPVNGAVHVF